eukprot:6338345-Pyramimonas_sp.AAC.1
MSTRAFHCNCTAESSALAPANLRKTAVSRLPKLGSSASLHGYGLTALQPTTVQLGTAKPRPTGSATRPTFAQAWGRASALPTCTGACVGSKTLGCSVGLRE